MHFHLILIPIVLSLVVSGCATTEKVPEPRKSARASEPVPRPKLRLVGLPADQSNDRSMTTLSTYKVSRSIGMYYKLDLQKDNILAPTMSEVMRLYEDRVRDCYLSRLEEMPGLRGKVALSFVLSRASGSMRKIVQIGGNLTDRPLLSCVAKQLAAMPFNPPRVVQGRLLYSFSADETVASTP